MLWRKHTDEFSVILPLDNKIADDIETIRAELPASPYRDDRPHVTLVKGIHTPYSMSDHELYSKLEPILDSLLKVEPHAHISRPSNARGGFYKRTSVIVLSASDPLRVEHRSLINALKGQGFKIKKHDRLFYSPHATIRLGVPLNPKLLKQARALFPQGKEIKFKGWIIYRLISKDGKRLFYEVSR
jgi:2'-5' RNA ligase